MQSSESQRTEAIAQLANDHLPHGVERSAIVVEATASLAELRARVLDVQHGDETASHLLRAQPLAASARLLPNSVRERASNPPQHGVRV